MSLTNDKKLICKLLLEQFNGAFSIPLSDKVVTDPVSFFAVSNACYKKSEALPTSINFSEQMIIDAISEIYASVLILRRTLLGYYAEGMHANFK